jgi:hypothetical protein
MYLEKFHGALNSEWYFYNELTNIILQNSGIYW